MLSTPPSLLKRLHDAADEDAKQRLVQYCSEFIYHWIYKRFHVRTRMLSTWYKTCL
jgi:hypothetical protein